MTSKPLLNTLKNPNVLFVAHTRLLLFKRSFAMEENVPKEEGITIAVKDATGEQTHFKVLDLLENFGHLYLSK